VGTYCDVAVRRGRLGGARLFGAHRGRRGTGACWGGRPHSWFIFNSVNAALLPYYFETEKVLNIANSVRS